MTPRREEPNIETMKCENVKSNVADIDVRRKGPSLLMMARVRDAHSCGESCSLNELHK